jgi:hypothetical protein
MSVELANRQTLDFMQALQLSDPQKIFSILVRNILLDENTDDSVKSQRICHLLDAYRLTKNTAC